MKKALLFFHLLFTVIVFSHMVLEVLSVISIQPALCILCYELLLSLSIQCVPSLPPSLPLLCLCRCGSGCVCGFLGTAPARTLTRGALWGKQGG